MVVGNAPETFLPRRKSSRFLRYHATLVNFTEHGSVMADYFRTDGSVPEEGPPFPKEAEQPFQKRNSEW